MNNTELAELFLYRLYEAAESRGHGRFVVLNDIAAEFGEGDIMKIHHLARALADRGLIRMLGSIGPKAQAHITGEGALFVEAGGNTGVIREYKENPQKYVVSIDQSTHFHGSVSGSTVSVTNTATPSVLPNEVVVMFQSMLEAVQNDQGLTAASRADLAADIANLRAELQRPKPRRPIAEALLATLGDATSITSFVLQMQQYLPALLRLGG